MQSTVPGFRRKLDIVLCTSSQVFFLIYPELILPTRVLNSYAVTLAASFGEARILIFFFFFFFRKQEFYSD